jgi:DNA segregation ATPase FtsK/SpoIIIE, S-DNA-T family
LTSYRLLSELNRRSDQIVLDVDDQLTTRAQVAQALQSAGYSGQFFVNGSSISGDLPASGLELVHGSRITSERHPDRALPTAPGRYLVAVAGPDAGSWVGFGDRSIITIGRGNSNIDLGSDRRLSNRHAEIHCADDAMLLIDQGSSNGTFVNGQPITESCELYDGDYLTVGDSVLTVVWIDKLDFAVIPPDLGSTRPFQRRFRSAQTPIRHDVEFPSKPSVRNDSHGNSWWRALLPLVAGIAMAIKFRSLFFLLISGITPIIYAFDSKRQAKLRAKEGEGEQAAYDRSHAQATGQLVELRRLEQERIRNDAPSSGVLVFWSLLLHRRLWERRPSDADFLAVTVGLGRLASAVGQAKGTPVSQEKVAQLIDTPISVSLLATGSLSVVGRMDRAYGVVRGFLISLAAAHSPSEVSLWVFTNEESANEWLCCRWLPHIFSDDTTARIAVFPEDCSKQFGDIRALVDRRTELVKDKSLQLPIQVFVVDGSQLLPTNLLSEVLEKGPAVGVIGIVLDSQVVADGTSASLSIHEQFGAAVFESRQLVVDEVRTSELSSEIAEQAAVRLAGLRTATLERPTVVDTSPRLVDLASVAALRPGELAQRWGASSPQTEVSVGKTAESELRIDIEKGPHGLIGGMTRSGKTEFLKTLVSALALANHPDDLNFVIVDFKGGVDYELARGFPHVLEVSSNDDLDRFERTIGLLGAERDRRQRYFRQAGVSNLNAYRSARKANPNLLAIPRLVILVDEFGELTATDIGKAHLKSLESLARVGSGLGMNLLLITQNFFGNLPEQISANSSLRVCFRVQEQSQSKVVLGSGLAASISSLAKGRAYVSIGGSDPVEFQSARVAGRRRDLESATTQATIRIQPFQTICVPASIADAPDVPSDETDMFEVVRLVKEEATRSGWKSSAVPWPESLSENVALFDVWLLARSNEAVEVGVDRFPIGLMDVPERQTQEPWLYDVNDDHLLLLGGPRADLVGVLTTIAVSGSLAASPNDLHFYVIDFTGRGLANLADFPHCGAIANRNEALASRIVSFLLDEATRRRSMFAEQNVSTLVDLRTKSGKSLPRILLLVSGADRFYSSEGNEGSPLVSAVSALVSEAVGLGIQVVMSGLPRIAAHNPGKLTDLRLAFITPEPMVYVGPTFPRALIADLGPPRRAIDIQRGKSVEICSVSGGQVAETDAVAAVLERIKAEYQAPLETPPVKFHEVGWPYSFETFLRIGSVSSPGSLPFAINPETERVIAINPEEDATDLLLAGGPKSGRSNALLVFGYVARKQGWQVLGIGFSRSSPLKSSAWIRYCEPEELGSVVDAYQGAPTLLLIDDLHRCDALTTPKLLGEIRPTLTIVAATQGSFGMGFRPYEALGLKTPKHGFVLAPSGVVETFPVRKELRADLLNSRRPGHGILVLHGEVEEVTIPLLGPTS